MTTRDAEAQYLAEHLLTWRGRPYAVHNPHGRPLAELPVIYGYNGGGSPGGLCAKLVAADGAEFDGHICSHEGYMPADLGVLEGSYPERHEQFRAHYPDGYRMEFVGAAEVSAHAGLQAAKARGRNRAEREVAS